MGLPHPFCKMYLPEKDTYFILENQNGKQYRAKYLARKTALSGGWRGFSIAEKLSEGDVLVFQLVQPTKLKVYILREGDWTENAQSRVVLSFPTEVVHSGTVAQSKDQEVLYEGDPQILQCVEKSEKHKSDFNTRNSEHVLFPVAVNDSGFASFEEFLIVIDDLLKEEYELPHKIKYSYYQLCSSQNAFLHMHLLKGINPLLIAGSIIETVNVAVALKSYELRTFDDGFAIMDEKLKSLKILGMKVGFLFSRLDHLQRIFNDPEAAQNRQHYEDLCSEHEVSESMIKDLEAKLSELIKAFDLRAADIGKLKSKIEDHKKRFQEQEGWNWRLQKIRHSDPSPTPTPNIRLQTEEGWS